MKGENEGTMKSEIRDENLKMFKLVMWPESDSVMWGIQVMWGIRVMRGHDEE